MKVCLVTQFYPPDTGGGGIAAYARYLAISLKQRGHEVRVISKLAPNSSPRKCIDGVEVLRLRFPLESYRWARVPVFGPYIRLLRDVIYAWRVRKTLLGMRKDWFPDIVEYADIDAEGLFHPRICPYVVKLHMPHRVMRPYYNTSEMPYARRGIEALESKTIRGADGISSPSRWLADQVSNIASIQRERINLVPNLIDADFFSPGTQPEDGSNPVVLYVGRLQPQKGAVVFTHAIPQIERSVPSARFVFLGADRYSATGHSQKAEIEESLRQAGVGKYVEFHGHADPDVFVEWYRRATVFVMPSLIENCPYTLLEAMSCAKPVVVSRAAGMSEMVEAERSGIMVEPGDADQLAKAVVSLLRSPEKCRALGKAARETVLRRYALTVGVEATEQFYLEVLKARDGRAAA